MPSLALVSVVGWAIGWVAPAVAADSSHSEPHEPFVDFALHVRIQDVEVDYDDNRNDDVIERRSLSVSFYEPLSPNVTVGFLAGRTFVTQDDRLATRGMDLDGYFLGLSVKSEMPFSERLALRLDADYSYHDVDGDTDEQDSSLKWHQLDLQLGLAATLTRSFGLVAGSRLYYADGEERTFGELDQTVDFSEAGNAGFFAGLELITDPSGYIGIIGDGGNPKGVHFYFQRRF